MLFIHHTAGYPVLFRAGRNAWLLVHSFLLLLSSNDLFPSSRVSFDCYISYCDTFAVLQHDPAAITMDSFCSYGITIIQKERAWLYSVPGFPDRAPSLFYFLPMEDAFVLIRHPGFPSVRAVTPDLGSFLSCTIPDVSIYRVVELFQNTVVLSPLFKTVEVSPVLWMEIPHGVGVITMGFL